jgi:periplasmic divalent cation tolerance protein
LKDGKKVAVALVTAPDLRVARKLARAALAARAAACVNLVPRIESHYWWKGRIENAAEVLLVFKTTVEHASTLERIISANHPYDTPEFVVLPVKAVNGRYLNWWIGSVTK